MDVLWLSRFQFALTIMFHYLFPPLTIGLGVMLVILEGLYLKTGDKQYEAATRFWTKIFALNFALGVAFGLPVGQVGGPVDGASAVMLIRKDGVTPAPMASFDSLKAGVSRGLLSTRQSRGFGAWIDWVRRNSKVEDRRGDVLIVD